jgi:hypothetical protein
MKIFLTHWPVGLSPDLTALPSFRRLLRGKPVAPVRFPEADAGHLLSIDMPKASPGYWLCATPVLMQATLDNVLVQAVDHLQEVQALIQSLNNLFAEDGWQFFAPAPDRWYVRLPKAPDVQWCAFHHVLGRQMSAFMPNGPEAMLWQRYLNEIQMLFYTHPVNEAKTIVSGVWFWGGAQYPAPEVTVQPEKVYCDNIFWQARALAAGYSVKPLSEAKIAADSILILDLSKDTLQTYETRYFQPALAQTVSLYCEGDTIEYAVCTRPRDQWKWWEGKLPPQKEQA